MLLSKVQKVTQDLEAQMRAGNVKLLTSCCSLIPLQIQKQNACPEAGNSGAGEKIGTDTVDAERLPTGAS